MILRLRRFDFGTNYTIGRLYIDGIFECYVLEDVVRPKGIKVFGETAIPKGTFRVVIDYSAHFKKYLPHLLDVPLFEGIRIHSGNTDKDTEGCLLLGTTWSGGDFIEHSGDAYKKFIPKLQAGLQEKGQVVIVVEDKET